MKRHIRLEDISDGKLYTSNDMVRTGCNGCQGCHTCCQRMGTSVILDPMDIFRLTQGLGQSFEQLLMGAVELNVVDGIILPNLKMTGEKQQCAFLNEEGRCSIHSIRPGVCRLFPLGRFYDQGSFKYFLQVHECPMENKTKVKVKRWLDLPDLSLYESYICQWHYFLDAVEKLIGSNDSQGCDDHQIKMINMYILNQFFVKPYQAEEDFYLQFDSRFSQARQALFGC